MLHKDEFLFLYAHFAELFSKMAFLNRGLCIKESLYLHAAKIMSSFL